jgi:arginine utilization protein RocB
VQQINASLKQGQMSTAAATWMLLDRLAELSDANQPLVIVGLLPPFYPSVVYFDRPEFTTDIVSLYNLLNSVAHKNWGQSYSLVPYIIGVSDMSFSSLNAAQEVEQVVSTNMPLYGDFFNVPFAELRDISMPCINIGPWGKDVHKMAERVLKEDLFERTPVLLLTAIRAALAWG